MPSGRARLIRYPLELELQPSRLALGLNAAIHLVAAFAFVRSSMHFILVIVALLLLILSVRSAARAEAGKLGCVLYLEGNGELRFETPGRVVYAVPERTCVDFGWVVWLHWRGARVRSPRRLILSGAMMLLPGNFAPGGWRELRIWLRHKAAERLDGQVIEQETGRAVARR